MASGHTEWHSREKTNSTPIPHVQTPEHIMDIQRYNKFIICIIYDKHN